MMVFARLVRMLLGQTAVADKKLACGNALEILGIIVSASLMYLLGECCSHAACAGGAVG